MTRIEDIIAIEDALIQRLIDTDIVGINGIVFNRGLRQGKLLVPYLHIFPDPSPIDDISGVATINEEWVFQWAVMAVAGSYTSEIIDEARTLAIMASSALMHDPVTGLVERELTVGGIPHVSDIWRATYHADYVRELPDEKLFGSAIEMQARKILQED